MVTIFSDSCSDLRNKSKNTSPKFFPREIGLAKNFGPKNSKIRVQTPKWVEIGRKWSEICGYVEGRLENNQKLLKKVPTVHGERITDVCRRLPTILWWRFLVTSHHVTSSLSVCLIWVDVQDFFPWELLVILFRNLMDRLLSIKGSDCAIFRIFPGTFWCTGQKFRDYFFIWTFSR